MDLSKYHLNFASVKRRGYDESTYQYIYTVHSFPVRMSGYEDIEYLKEVNQRFVYGYEPGQSEDESVRYAASLCRYRSRVLQLAFNNKWDYFVTLTFDKDKIDRYDYKAICSTMLKFFDNYKQRKSKDFKYLLIPEQHKDGAFHFHGYFSGIKPGDVRSNEWGYLDFVPYRKKFGFCSISEIEDREKCAVYVSKYITKDMFNSTPPPRTHLYFASRGLKFDEVISVGHAPTALVPPANSEQFSCRFCHKFVSDTNIFWTEPFTSLDVAPELPSAVDLNQYKIAALYKFCNNNGLYLNDQTDLLRKYESMKKAIFDDYHNGYDCLKSHFAALRKEFKALDSMTDDQIEAIFASAAVDDFVADTGNLLQISSAAASIPLHPPKDVIQLSMFEGDHYAVE